MSKTLNKSDVVRVRRIAKSFCFVFIALATASCGFHLRGRDDVAIPESLSTLRATVEDSKLANDPLLVMLKNVLQTSAHVTVTEDSDAPMLALFGERTRTDVLSVSAGGRASGYTLRYEVGFRLIAGDGAVLVEPQMVRLMRDYTFDPLNVLAKEQEELELKRLMQRDAVQQILRRVARYKVGD